MWDRYLTDGLHQFVYQSDDVVIRTKTDVTDGKCRECWEMIKAEYPIVKGYKEFCACYRDAKKEFNSFMERNERSYNMFWGVNNSGHK